MTIDEALWQDEDRVSGAVCFRDTRVPVSILFEYLETGDVEEFFVNFPNVSREQVQAVIHESEKLITGKFSPRKAA